MSKGGMAGKRAGGKSRAGNGKSAKALEYIQENGRYWDRGESSGKHRSYLSDSAVDELARQAGMEFDRRNSGQIYGATLNGENISNSEANRLLYGKRIYYDWDAGEFKSSSSDELGIVNRLNEKYGRVSDSDKKKYFSR